MDVAGLAKRRLTMGLGFVAWALAFGCAEPTPPERPNLLVFVVDTLRADELGCHGASVTRTPFIDAFAASSVRFSQARSPSSWTRPAIASLLTGVVPDVHGIHTFADHLPEASAPLPRLPELLQAAGYHTVAIVTNPQLDPTFGFSVGFDEYEVLYEQRTRRKERYEAAPLAASVLVTSIQQAITRAPRERPFFLFGLAIDPHGPYEPPEGFDVYAAEPARSGTQYETERARYRGEVSYVDAAFGKLVAWLGEQGLQEETVVVLTSDHGEEFGEHGLRAHGKTVYEEILHIPLILRAPWLSTQVRDEAVDLMDLSATLAGFAGIERHALWRGRDLRGDLEERPVFSSSRLRREHHYTAVVRGQHKLIVDDRTHERRYFDLELDPEERQPRAEGEPALGLALDAFRNDAAAARAALGPNRGDASSVPEEIRARLEALGYESPKPPPPNLD